MFPVETPILCAPSVVTRHQAQRPVVAAVPKNLAKQRLGASPFGGGTVHYAPPRESEGKLHQPPRAIRFFVALDANRTGHRAWERRVNEHSNVLVGLVLIDTMNLK